MVRPERKSQVFSGPTAFSQTYAAGSSNTRELHFGHGPSDSWPLKSGASPSAPSPGAVAEVELHFVGVVELQLGRERSPELAAKAFERADFAMGEQRLGFGNLELAPGDDFPHAEIARLALELLVVLVDFAAAFRTTRGQRCKVSRDRVALVVLRLPDDVLRHLHDLAHELRALQLAVLHLRQLEFPFGGELRRKQLRHAESVQERHQ